MQKCKLMLSLLSSVIAVLVITISAAVAESDGSLPDRYKLAARRAVYSISEDQSHQGVHCLYRNRAKLFCHDPGYVAFERRVKTRNYDLIVVSLPNDGSGLRWWDWKLIVEGKRSSIKTLAIDCIACDIREQNLKPHLDEVDFVYRQKQHQISAKFRGGVLSIRRTKLGPLEPLPEGDCDRLYGGLERCSHGGPCSVGSPNSQHFFVMEIEDKYAGISYRGLDQQCQAACSTGKTMDRGTFFRNVCRR